MSKLIPPLVSTTPPPIGLTDGDDNEDDEFGNFTAASAVDDSTYGCGSFSISNIPEASPKKLSIIFNDTLEISTGVGGKISEIKVGNEDTKDYQDKRKNLINVDNAEPMEKLTFESDIINGIDVPNLPLPFLNNSESLNGHNCFNNDQGTGDEHKIASVVMVDSKLQNKLDGIERPLQLFDDDSDDKEEVSETPSNFSISFDDNVICDEEEDVSDNIELPNHVNEADNRDDNRNKDESVEKVVETCKNIQEFDDFDDEWRQVDSSDQIEIKESYDGCMQSIQSQLELTMKVERAVEEDFDDFNVFDEAPLISLAQPEEIIEESVGSCDNQSNVKFSADNNQCINTDMEKVPVKLPSDSVNIDGDFDDFQFPDFSFTLQNRPKVDSVEETTIVAEKCEDFDDFADFSSAPIEFSKDKFDSLIVSQSTTCSSSFEQDNAEDDDDFGDFDDYTTSSTTLPTSTTTMNKLLNPDKVYDETQVIFKVMFESVMVEEKEYKYSDETVKNNLFSHIKDVTETHALRYQWGKSQVQQVLLRALNIDTRNILHVHGMPMPKFAANLGMTPLEPVKSDILTPTPATSNRVAMTPFNPSSDDSSQSSFGGLLSQSNLTPSGDIPAAQFDWSASGLANPLDSNQSSTLFDLEQLTASLSLPTATICAVIVDSNHANEKINEDWDMWLQSVSKEESKPTSRTSRTSDDIKLEDSCNLQTPPTYDTESVNSLQFPEMVDVEDSKQESEVADDFSDFNSFQSTYPIQNQQQTEQTATWTTTNMIPLRETYIDDVKSNWNENSTISTSNNHSRKSSYESVGKFDAKCESDWAQPTISIPVLPHKNVLNFECTAKTRCEDDDFADFQDFQTGATADSIKVEEIETPKDSKLNILNAYGGNVQNSTIFQPTMLEPVKLASALETQTILWPNPGITDEELARFDLYTKKDGNYTSSSLKGGNSEAVMTKSSLDPSTSSVSVSKAPETKLSGPGGALMVEKHVVVPANKVILPFNEVLLPPNNQVVISKDLVLPILESSPRKYIPQQKTPALTLAAHDDDDWSDFISTQPTYLAERASEISGSNGPPSKHTLNSTSTPELSLSIPQLRSLQKLQPPGKPPIPVITPRGLVQTKIPTMASSTPVKSLPQTALHVQPPVDGYQPSIISTQFVQQLNLNTNINQTPFAGFLQNGHCQTTSIPTNGPHRPNHPPLQTNQYQSPQKNLNGFHDDDEWSDFMSSQPVNTGNHSLYTLTTAAPTLQPMRTGNPTLVTTNYNQPNLFDSATNSQPTRTDWNRNGYPSDLPNIITNPVHFQSYPTMNTPTNVLNKKSASTNGILHSKNKKPQNLNVTRLPDLDFVAPKAKVFQNNKK